jgi:hypothetical protein
MMGPMGFGAYGREQQKKRAQQAKQGGNLQARASNLAPEAPVQKVKSLWCCRGCGQVQANYFNREQPASCRLGDRCPWEQKRLVPGFQAPDQRWFLCGDNPAASPTDPFLPPSAPEMTPEMTARRAEPEPEMTADDFRAEWVADRVARLVETMGIPDEGTSSGEVEAAAQRAWGWAATAYDVGREKGMLP